MAFPTSWLTGLPALGAGGAALEAIPALMRTPEEKFNKRRLDQLMAMDSLGLTPQERADIERSHMDAIEGAQRSGERQAAGALSNAVGGSGDALARSVAAQQATIAPTRDAVSDVAAQNAQRRSELEGERDDRLSFQAQTRRARVAALANIPGAAIKGGIQQHEENTQLGLRGTPEEQTVDRASRIAALSPSQVEQLRAYMQAHNLDTSILPSTAVAPLPEDDLFANRMSGRPY